MKSILCAAVGIVMCTASPAQVLNFRSWVASYGSDANNCTRSAPCRTLEVAYFNTVVGGEITVADAAQYDPSAQLVITHAITIDGGAGGASLWGAVINAGSDTVIFRNITFNGTNIYPSGLSVPSVGQLHVEHCTFTGPFKQDQGGSNRAIEFSATSGRLFVRDSTVTNVGGIGIYVGNAHATLERVTLNGNGTGVLAAGSSAVSVTHGVATGNGTGFAAAYGPTAQINLDDCLMADNQWAVVVSQGATAYVGGSSLFNNYIKALYNDGVSFLVSYGTNRFAGNATDGSFTSGMAVR